MSKTLLAHDLWYTSLQLLEMVVDVEVQLLVEFLACPAPPCKLDMLGLFSGNLGIDETALAVHLFLVFLSCAWFLMTYPAACRWMKQMARVLAEKSLYMTSHCFPGR